MPEDQIIVYTWHEFIYNFYMQIINDPSQKYTNPQWFFYLNWIPMTRPAHRTIQFLMYSIGDLVWALRLWVLACGIRASFNKFKLKSEYKTEFNQSKTPITWKSHELITKEIFTSDISRAFLGRPIHTSNPQKCHHGQRH